MSSVITKYLDATCVYEVDNLGRTLLHICSREDVNGNIVKSLIENQASIDLQDRVGNTALHTATFHNNIIIVKLLLDNGANVHLQSNGGNTALHIATVRNNINIVKSLIDNGANVHLRSECGKTPLCLISKDSDKHDSDHMGILKLLIEANACINSVDNHGETLLHMVARKKICGVC